MFSALGFLPPLRGLICLRFKPTADAVGYFLTALRACIPVKTGAQICLVRTVFVLG
jgi:hypothetical protein